MPIMPNITRGQRMTGLMRYLVRVDEKGREHNPHEHPQFIAGDQFLEAMVSLEGVDVRDLDNSDARKLTDYLEQSIREQDSSPVGGAVWHCSLSVPASEGELSAEKWSEIAHDFMREMGFESDRLAVARWAAIRHGKSKDGNDHVHIAASIVREDGRFVDVFRDRIRAQKVARDLEAKHGLVLLADHNARQQEPALSRTEIEIARRNGDSEPTRRYLERCVRGAATASLDEAEFVRRLRQYGLVLRPSQYARTADGTLDRSKVTGYSVAMRTRRGSGEKLFYLGGRSLAEDLSLPKLREYWGISSSPDRAAPEWFAARDGRPPVAPGREAQVVTPAVLTEAARELAEMNKRLHAIPTSRREEWANAARETAGVFAGWSTRLEPTPGPLAETAKQLTRSARANSARVTRRQVGNGFARAGMVVAGLTGGATGQSVYALTVALGATIRDIIRAHEAEKQIQRAHELTAHYESILRRLDLAKLGTPGAVMSEQEYVAKRESDRVAREQAARDKQTNGSVAARKNVGQPQPVRQPRGGADAQQRPSRQPGREPGLER